MEPIVSLTLALLIAAVDSAATGGDNPLTESGEILQEGGGLVPEIKNKSASDESKLKFGSIMRHILERPAMRENVETTTESTLSHERNGRSVEVTGPITRNSKQDGVKDESGFQEDSDSAYNDLSEKLDKFQVTIQSMAHPVKHRRFQADSCRKYLEFLKYAFEELDKDGKLDGDDNTGEYYYYDDELGKSIPQEEMPMFITPDVSILKKVAVPYNKVFMKTSETEENDFSVTEKRSLTSPNRSRTSTTEAPATSALTDPEVLRRGTTQPTIFQKSVTATTPLPATTIPPPIGNRSADRKYESEIDWDIKFYPCPDSVNVTYPVNGFCNRFVSCEGGRPNPEFCQAGLHYNLVQKECDLPHNSFCTYSCPTSFGYYAIPGDCEGFFRCSNWYPTYRLCPPQMHWDNNAKICTFEELSSCPLKCDSPYEVKKYKGVCNAYIICTRGIPRYHQCPDGQHFDEKQLKCVAKQLSNCLDGENYIARNRGRENGRETLCADIELNGGGKARWCQDIIKDFE